MHLKHLSMRGFRKLSTAEIDFHPTLNVIVGENNAGKTAVVDGLRTVLASRDSVMDDLTYDRNAREHDRYTKSSELEATFCGLSVAEEALFIEALVPGSVQGQYDASIRSITTRNGDSVQRYIEVGQKGSGTRSTDVLRNRRLIYLQPLRDPSGDRGLRPGRYSQLANLLRRTANDQPRREELEKIAKGANLKLKKTAAVTDARVLLKRNLLSLTGPNYSSKPDLGFVEPEFERLIATLEAMAETMQISMNGLGSNNLYYIAAVLADLTTDKAISYRALVIEEPEAHLHPHYQILLLRFLSATAANASHPVQVFITTHSPILASQVAQAGILPLAEFSRGVYRAAPIDLSTNRRAANRVKQYLDATRSELFFARRLLFVEGDGERFLIPALARTLNIDLNERGVSVISAAGLNFRLFIPFVKADVLNIPVSIIVDKDPDTSRPEADGSPADSLYLKSLRDEIESDARIEVFSGKVTLEYDIALPQKNKPYVLAAMKRLHPRKAAEFNELSGALTGADFAEAFHHFFFRPAGKRKAVSKADFALELALFIDRGNAPDLVVPPYIKRAINHVLKAVRDNG